jgi:hypothetical protein
MCKRQPGGSRVLRVESLGWAGGEFGVGQAVDGLRVRYALESGDDIELLEELQWADWDREGRLLAATRPGKLQIREVCDGCHATLFEEDLSRLAPDPAPSPEWARHW